MKKVIKKTASSRKPVEPPRGFIKPNMAKKPMMKSGGAKKSSPKAHPSITVTSAKDPRYQAYKDSMTLYNYSKNLKDIYNKKGKVTSAENFGSDPNFKDVSKSKYNWEGSGAKRAYENLNKKNAAPTPKETTYPNSYYTKGVPRDVTSEFPKPVKKVTYVPKSTTKKIKTLPEVTVKPKSKKSGVVKKATAKKKMVRSKKK